MTSTTTTTTKMGYHFVSETEPCEEYICPVTNTIMLEPHQTHCCGHHLSASVAERLREENRPCPMCSVPGPKGSSSNVKRAFTTGLDLYFRKKIHNLLVYCQHRKEGCKWEGPIKDFQSHTLSCDMTPWECGDCGFQSSQLRKSEHIQECPKRVVSCDCGESPILACDYEQHCLMCPAQPVPCKFADIGCMVTSPRKDMAAHLKDDVANHQLLISEQNLKVTMEIKSKLDTRVMEAEDSTSEVTKLQKELEEKEGELVTLRKELETQKHDIAKREAAMKKRSKELASTVRDRQLEQLEMQLDERDDTIQRLRAQNESVVVGTAAFESLQTLAVGLRNKRSMSSKEIEQFKAKLDEIVDKISDTQSQCSFEGGSSPSPVGIHPEVGRSREKTRVQFCRGNFERVVMTGLKRPWGMALGGDKLYVVDNGGSFGIHMIGLQETSTSSVETMIESASISDITISSSKCWYPKGVALDKNLNLILTDTGCHRVLKFSPSGELLAAANQDGVSGSTSCMFNHPIGVAVDSKNRAFICDRSNHRIQILDKNLQFVEEFGQMGSGPKEFMNPWDVAFDLLGNVYVVDCGNRCVKVFTSKLAPLRTIGKGDERDKYRKGDLRVPTSVCVDRNNYIYVADGGLKRVYVYNPDGKFCCNFGKFTNPNGIAVDKDGHVFVSDLGGGSFLSPLQPCGRVQMFS